MKDYFTSYFDAAHLEIKRNNFELAIHCLTLAIQNARTPELEEKALVMRADCCLRLGGDLFFTKARKDYKRAFLNVPVNLRDDFLKRIFYKASANNNIRNFYLSRDYLHILCFDLDKENPVALCSYAYLLLHKLIDFEKNYNVKEEYAIHAQDLAKQALLFVHKSSPYSSPGFGFTVTLPPIDFSQFKGQQEPLDIRENGKITYETIYYILGGSEHILTNMNSEGHSYSDSLRYFEEGIRLYSPSKSAGLVANRAAPLISLGRVMEAIKTCHDAIEIQWDSSAYHFLAHIYKVGNYHDAYLWRKNLMTSLALNAAQGSGPRTLDFYLFRFEAACITEHFEEAKKILESGQQVFSQSEELHLAFAQLYELNGDKLGAYAAIKRALEINQENATAQLYLSRHLDSFTAIVKMTEPKNPIIGTNDVNLTFEISSPTPLLYVKVLGYSGEKGKEFKILYESKVSTNIESEGIAYNVKNHLIHLPRVKIYSNELKIEVVYENLLPTEYDRHEFHEIFKIYLSTDRQFLPAKRIAMVVGNSEYLHHRIDKLKNPINDANAIASKLKGLGFELLDNGPLLNLDYQSFLLKLEDFRLASLNYDVAIFYYAGHGCFKNGVHWLIPCNDGRSMFEHEQNLREWCIDTSYIALRLQKVPFKILIFDACRNVIFENRNLLLTPSSWFQKSMLTPKGTVSAYSTSIGEIAIDSHPTKENGLYTGELLDLLEENDMTIQEIFDEVRARVRNLSNNSQVPAHYIDRGYDLRILCLWGTLPVMFDTRCQTGCRAWQK